MMENELNYPRSVGALYESPHAAIVASLRAYMSRILFSYRGDNLENFCFEKERFESDLMNLLDLTSNYCFIDINNDCAESYHISGVCTEYMTWPTYKGDSSVNGISLYENGSRFVVFIDSGDWGFESENCPYRYPAVGYSPEEFYGFFFVIYSMRAREFAKDTKNFTALFSQYAQGFHIADVINRLHKKISGDIAWDYGPARKQEPNINQWYENAGSQTANEWILQWFK